MNTRELAQADLKECTQSARLLGATVPQDWPPPFNDAASTQYNADRLQESPDQAGWRAWYFLKPGLINQERRLIGIAGFVEPPSADGRTGIQFAAADLHPISQEAVHATRR